MQLPGFFRDQLRTGLSGNAVRFSTGQPCPSKAASPTERGVLCWGRNSWACRLLMLSKHTFVPCSSFSQCLWLLSCRMAWAALVDEVLAERRLQHGCAYSGRSALHRQQGCSGAPGRHQGVTVSHSHLDHSLEGGDLIVWVNKPGTSQAFRWKIVNPIYSGWWKEKCSTR